MPTPILIFGSGGTCLDIADVIADLARTSLSPKYLCHGFLDDREQLWGSRIADLPVLGSLSSAVKYKEYSFINGIGSPVSFRNKESIVARANLPLERFATVVHPSAVVSPRASLGAGVAILPHVTICAGAVIGDHVIILPGSVVGHDSIIGSYSCIAAQACISGGVVVGASCYIGAGATLRERITIGSKTLVGMGSAVVGDIGSGATVMGVPAKPRY